MKEKHLMHNGDANDCTSLRVWSELHYLLGKTGLSRTHITQICDFHAGSIEIVQGVKQMKCNIVGKSENFCFFEGCPTTRKYVFTHLILGGIKK
jgi:hypothetical protein